MLLKLLYRYMVKTISVNSKIVMIVSSFIFKNNEFAVFRYLNYVYAPVVGLSFLENHSTEVCDIKGRNNLIAQSWGIYTKFIVLSCGQITEGFLKEEVTSGMKV